MEKYQPGRLRNPGYQSNLDHYLTARKNWDYQSKLSIYSHGRIRDPYEVLVERSLQGPRSR